MREEVRESPEAEAAILRHLSGLHAMAGRFELARELLATSVALCAELGLTLNAVAAQNEAFVELLAGNPAAAEASLRGCYQMLEDMGERAFRSTTAAMLARALLEQGRLEEAEELALLSARLASSGDLLTQLLWRSVRARVLAARGAFAEAEALALAAVELAATSDFLNCRGDAVLDLSRVLARCGKHEEALKATGAALALYERKGNVVAAGQAVRQLGELAKM
jgi:tetratricopeptide (TPR) repeat protein